MFKIFSLSFCLFLGACTYQYTSKNNLDIEGIEKIYLNVKSFQIKKNKFESSKIDDSLQYEITKRVLKKFETWVWEKLAIIGSENTA